jgi:uncharacterized membrane protein YphA (DoxX/SURF4 family)
MLLRVAVGITLIVQGAAYIPELDKLHIGLSIACALTLGTGIALLVGLLTRFFGGLAVAVYIALTLAWWPAPSYNFFFGNPLAFDVITMAAVCTLLGPGAYSLDARLFGRRRIVFPQSPHIPDPPAQISDKRSDHGKTR